MDQIKNFISAVAKGENVEAKSFLEDELATRAFESLEGMKKEIASSLFGVAEEPVSEETQEALDNFSAEEIEEFMMSEEYEQLDELSKKTLGNYIKKASRDASSSSFKASDFTNQAEKNLEKSLNWQNPDYKFNKRVAGHYIGKKLKRDAGIDKATDRLTKEDIEHLDEAKKLISKHGDGVHTAKVYKDPEYNEYQAHFFKNGKHMGEGPVSYHDDKEDAQGTAEAQLKRMNKQ